MCCSVSSICYTLQIILLVNILGGCHPSLYWTKFNSTPSKHIQALPALVPVDHLTVHVSVGLVVDHVGGHPLVGAVPVEYLNRGISK